MAVNEGCKQTAVNVSGKGCVVGLRPKPADRFVAVPVSFNLIAMFVRFSTPITHGDIIWIIILDRFFIHMVLSIMV
jgi:hypothetical protein